MTWASNIKQQYKLSLLCLVIFFSLLPFNTFAQSSLSQLKGTEISGGIYYFQRNRQRFNALTDNYEQNLNHSTSLAAINSHSPLFSTPLSLDISAYAAYDFSIIEDNKVNQENEFSFADNRWCNNYKANDDGSSENGISFSKLVIHYEINQTLNATFGFSQFNIPGLIGTNWSFLPDTYRGFNLMTNIFDIKVNYIWVDKYKAPWFKNMQGFSTQNAWASPFDNQNKIDYLHSLSFQSEIQSIDTTLAIGQSQGYMDSIHLKLARQLNSWKNLSISYHLYGSNTKSEWDS
jgi:hypothetical protein